MAETQDGEYYYDAGTINEQLDDYEVYEVDGRLYLNKEGADPEEAVSFDGITEYLQNERTDDDPDGTELAEGEFAIYAHRQTGGTDGIELRGAYYDGTDTTVVTIAEFQAYVE